MIRAMSTSSAPGLLAGRVALVSGANRGIGLAVVRGIAERGATVFLGARDLAAGEAAAAALRADGHVVHALELDVTDRASITAAVASIDAAHGRLDVLVNNAGILTYDNAVDFDPDTAELFWKINTLGPWLLAAAAVPLMRRNGWGRIVNVSTEMASFTRMTASAPSYRVSKTALNAVTRVLALELDGSGILVNAVSPGWVRTAMGGPAAPRSIEQGCASILWGVDVPDGGPNGEFFQDGAALPW
jgi:NAD(P)-dependent dehydrogenase (short-subunit alcohol dehydrogenase family)